MRVLWTDGSASPNPGPGGLAVIDGETKKPVFLAHEKVSSNIRMEGAAIYCAMRLAKGEPVEIHSDSEFWKNVLEKWAPNWVKNDYQKKVRVMKDGEVTYKFEKVKNAALVKLVYELYQESDAKIKWVRGHDGVELNELCDKWAKKARKCKTFENLTNYELNLGERK